MPKVGFAQNSNDNSRAKKRVNRANRRKYAGQEDMAVANDVDTAAITNGLVSRLTDMVASVNEISSQLNLTAGQNAPWASKAIDKYISASSALKKQVVDANTFIETNMGAMLNLNEADLASITKADTELTDTFKEVTSAVGLLSPTRQAAIKKVFAVFVPDLVSLSQTLAGKVLSQSSSGIPIPQIKAQPFSAATTPSARQEAEAGAPAAAKPAWKGDNVNFFQKGKNAGKERSEAQKAALRKQISKSSGAAGGDPNTSGVAEMFGQGMCGGSHPLFGTFASGGALMFPPRFSGMVGNKKDDCGRSSGTRYYGTPCVGGGVDLGSHPYMPTRFL